MGDWDERVCEKGVFGCGVEMRVEKRLGFDSLARISMRERISRTKFDFFFKFKWTKVKKRVNEGKRGQVSLTGYWDRDRDMKSWDS